MKESSRDISNKIDPAIVAVFDALLPLTGDLPFFVVGATARDIFLHYLHDIRIVRATADVDLGIKVSSWREYEDLAKRLDESGQFHRTKAIHRFMHVGGYPIDLVPFGGIERDEAKFKWPPDYSEEMNVLGFDDAYRCSQRICLRRSPLLDVRFADPAGVTLLKIIAWRDRPTERTNDAKDLFQIVKHYLDLGNYERLVQEEWDILDTDDFNTVVAGARLLGRDLSRVSRAETAARLLQILREEAARAEKSRLVQQMWSASVNSRDEVDPDMLHRLLRETILGLEDGLKAGL
jgi:predicted nucleotidyltransferase